MEKTIHGLNQRAWYRLLKVVYLLAFVLVALASVATILSEYQPYTLNDYRIICNYGNKSSFIAYERGIYISSYNPDTSLALLPSYTKTAMSRECQITQEDLQLLGNAIVNDQPHDPLYTIKREEYTHGSWVKVALISLVTLLIVFGVFEGIRRAFYYVVLGSLRPSRK